MGIYQWDTTASDNDDAADDINWAEGQNPATVNDSAREMMADVAEFLLDLSCSVTTSSTGNAYTLTTNGTIPALADGLVVGFKTDAGNTGAATLAVDGLAAKPIRHTEDEALQLGDLLEGAHYLVVYDSSADSGLGAWLLLNPSRGKFVLSAANETIAGTKTFTSKPVVNGLELTAAFIHRDSDNSRLLIDGGTSGNGARVEVTGSGFTTPNSAIIDANFIIFRGAGGSGTPDVELRSDSSSAFTINSDGNALFIADSDANSIPGFHMQSDGVDRWRIQADTAETGSDAGSDLRIYAYDDSGTQIGQALAFRRSDGRTSLPLTYSITTASAANMHIAAGGIVSRSTSSERYKRDIEPMSDTAVHAVLGMRPVWYRSRCAEDPPEWSYYGLIAEEVAEIDPRLVDWRKDEAGELIPESVMYDRLVPHLIALVQKQQKRLVSLSHHVEAMRRALDKRGIK